MVGTLKETLDDPDGKHPEEAAWAGKLVALMRGRDGFNKLVKFGVDCDFAVTCNRMIRLQDKPSADLALTVTEVTECLEMCYVLFEEGRAFDLQDNHTYTGHLLRSFLLPDSASGQEGVAASSQGAAAVSRQRGAKALGELGIGWPKDISVEEALKEGKRYAKTLYKMAFKFMKLNYPDYSWRTKFGAFTCGATAFPEAYRLDCLEKLAVKENLDKAQTRHQFQQVFPHMKRLYQETGDNRLAWAKLLESLRVRRDCNTFRADMQCVVSLAVTFIGLLDVTTCVERCFARLQRLEIKSRERHCHPSRLHDSLNIVLQVPSNVDALVTRTPAPVRLSASSKAPLLQLLWLPSPLITKAQSKYAEFFGRRALECRSMEAKPLALRAQEFRGTWVKKNLKSGLKQGSANITKGQLKQKWTAHVTGLVKSWRKRKGSLQPGSSGLQQDANCGLQPAAAARQKIAFDALARRKLKDRFDFEKAERETGLARPVKPLLTRAKAKAKAKATPQAKGEKRSAATAFEQVWFDCEKLAKASKLDLKASQDKASAQILVVDDYEKSLKSSSASLHCRLHGKTLASSEVVFEKGVLKGPSVKFAAPTSEVIVFPSPEVLKKHGALMQELRRSKRVRILADEKSMLATCATTASSQARWLGVKAEIVALASKLKAAKVPASRAVACTASHFVQNVGTVV